jgi:phosphoglycerate dehydrogenase-like enzyme
MEAYQGQAVVLGEPGLLAPVLDQMPQVRWVQSSWAGVTPLLQCRRGNLVLTGIKDVFGGQMAEYVFAYLLAREVRLMERQEHQSRKSWWDMPSGCLQGKTLGVMGTGSIGRAIAERGCDFGMEAVGFSRSGSPVSPFRSVWAGDRLNEFLALPDYLVTVLPDTPETRGLLDAKAWSRVKNNCFLVNVGRGTLIDELALVDALEGGQLAGAVLDVFRQEPLPQDSPLWRAPNLLLTAHIAAISRPSDIAGIFSENYRRYCRGEPLKYRIDFDRGY